MKYKDLSPKRFGSGNSVLEGDVCYSCEVVRNNEGFGLDSRIFYKFKTKCSKDALVFFLFLYEASTQKVS